MKYLELRAIAEQSPHKYKHSLELDRDLLINDKPPHFPDKTKI